MIKFFQNTFDYLLVTIFVQLFNLYQIQPQMLNRNTLNNYCNHNTLRTFSLFLLLAFFGKEPEIYGYYADYDWVLLCSLFGRMIDLPKGFPMYCIDLKQIIDEKAETIATAGRYATNKKDALACTHDILSLPHPPGPECCRYEELLFAAFVDKK